MAWIAVSTAVSAAPAIFKGIKGINQSNQADAMHPTNPGYQMNRGVLANAKTLSDTYGNYQLPGYSTMKQNVNNTFQNAFDSGVKGATTGGDVLDLATKIAYGKNQALNQLGVQNAQGKQNMLGQYLNGQAAAGQEYQDQNAYDRDQYDRQLREKAALEQAGATNEFSAMDQLAGALGKYGFSQAGNTSDATRTNNNTLGTPIATGITPASTNYVGNGVTMSSPFVSNLSGVTGPVRNGGNYEANDFNIDAFKNYIAKNGIR